MRSYEFDSSKITKGKDCSTRKDLSDWRLWIGNEESQNRERRERERERERHDDLGNVKQGGSTDADTSQQGSVSSG